MNRSLEDAKSKVRERYLGKHGIHGVGLRESEGAVCVYLHPPEGPEQVETLKAIELELAPIKLIKVFEAAPSAGSATG